MRQQMPLGDFLVSYLLRAGVRHIFGLPGDLVLNLFYKFAESRGLSIVTLSHEPGVGFAADGYARATGRLGVMVVTYGAGGHNVVNAVAGSFAEEVPLLVVSGGPGEGEIETGRLIHHQAKEIESQRRIFEEVTCETRMVRQGDRAAREVHALVQRILQERRPGYLEIHRDVVDREIDVPACVRDWDGSGVPTPADRGKVVEAARETVDRINAARAPVMVAGIELHRARSGRQARALAERMGAPVVTTVLAKGAFPEDHALYQGVHMGTFSAAPIRRRVQRADLLLELGTLPTDINLGISRRRDQPERRVRASGGQVQISRHTFTDVPLRAFLRGLLRVPKLRHHREQVQYADNLKPPRSSTRTPVRINDLLWTVNEFLAERRDYYVFAESGDMLFGGLEVRLPPGGLYFAQGFYASMGFAVPGALGAQIGTGKRPLVLCGDGAFQMTGPEIAHAPRHGCNPIVVLINNGGWGIFRPVSPKTDLLDLPSWPYAEMARGWGGLGLRARNVDELRATLAEADGDPRFSLIEVDVAPGDLSPISRRYIRASAAQGRRERSQ